MGGGLNVEDDGGAGEVGKARLSRGEESLAVAIVVGGFLPVFPGIVVLEFTDVEVVKDDFGANLVLVGTCFAVRRPASLPVGRAGRRKGSIAAISSGDA